MKTLNVRRTNEKEIHEQWGFKLISCNMNFPKTDTVYIRCNAKGKVNWNTAPVYQPEELITRNNVNIVKP